MANSSNLVGLAVRATGLGGLLGGLGFGWLFVLGPYGIAQPMPAVCAQNATCVIVAGLDDDVNIGPGAGGQAFGFDINDQVTRRLVQWLRDAAPPGQSIQVYRYPREITMPDIGTINEPAQKRSAINTARDVGQRFNARLVIVGRVIGDSTVSLAFINPRLPPADLELGDYAMTNAGLPPNFPDDFRSALAAASVHTFAPRPMAVAAVRQFTPAAQPQPTPPSESAPPRELTPPVATTTPISTTAPAPMLTPARRRQADFTAAQVQNFLRSTNHHAFGHAVINCQVSSSGVATSCNIVSESPQYGGFGRAAVRMALATSYDPATQDGRPVDGGAVTLSYDFPPTE